jgi:hypothetical protein
VWRSVYGGDYVRIRISISKCDCDWDWDRISKCDCARDRVRAKRYNSSEPDCSAMRRIVAWHFLLAAQEEDERCD